MTQKSVIPPDLLLVPSMLCNAMDLLNGCVKTLYLSTNFLLMNKAVAPESIVAATLMLLLRPFNKVQMWKWELALLTSGTTHDSKLLYISETSESERKSFCDCLLFLSMFLCFVISESSSITLIETGSVDTEEKESLDRSAAACTACRSKKPFGEQTVLPPIPFASPGSSGWQGP